MSINLTLLAPRKTVTRRGTRKRLVEFPPRTRHEEMLILCARIGFRP
jgi:hypothetical protein